MIASGNALKILTSAIPFDFEYLLSDLGLAPIEEIWINFFTPLSFAKIASFSGASECICLNFLFFSSFNIPTQFITISELLSRNRCWKLYCNRYRNYWTKSYKRSFMPNSNMY